VAHRQRHAAGLEPVDEDVGRRLAQVLALAGLGPVEQRAVLGHDAVEQHDPGKDAEQLVELAPGDEDQLAAGFLQAREAVEDVVGDGAVMRDGPVVVEGDGGVAHGTIRPFGESSLRVQLTGRTWPKKAGAHTSASTSAARRACWRFSTTGLKSSPRRSFAAIPKRA